MATEVATTGLGHIAEHQIDPAVLSQHCVSWSVWVLSIRACIDVSVPSASVEVYLMGGKLGQCILNPGHSKCKIGGSIDGFRAQADLEIVGNCLKVEAEVCAPIVGCKKWQHDIFCW